MSFLVLCYTSCNQCLSQNHDTQGVLYKVCISSIVSDTFASTTSLSDVSQNNNLPNDDQESRVPVTVETAG